MYRTFGKVTVHVIDYRKRDGGRHLLNRGVFVKLPRLMLWCRMFGHKPVVDGTGRRRTDMADAQRRMGTGYQPQEHRWVACDRCGVRGEPQGNLDPQVFAIGDAYNGPWRYDPLPTQTMQRELQLRDEARGWRPPGPLGEGDGARGEVGGQFIVGPLAYGGIGFEVKVGNSGSEHTLAANVHLWPFGAVYLHTERFGTWLQRRLNPVGYESRLIGLRISGKRLSWKLWAKRNESSRDDPWWMHGDINLSVMDRLFGAKRYSYTDVGQKVARVARMPEGDYLVNLQLQRCAFGRKRGRKKRSWVVDWDAIGRGIPTRYDDGWKGPVTGSGTEATEAAVRAGTWPAEAAAAIVVAMTRDRTRNRYDPTELVPVPVEQIEQAEKVTV